MTATYQRIEVRPMSGALGAEICGVDLARDLDGETIAEIRRAFLEHLVICLRDQVLSVEQHKAFGRRFGALDVHPYVKPLDGHPEIIRIIKEPTDKQAFGGTNWHSDVPFFEAPSMGTILYAREVPPRDGDTAFANLYLGYEALSDGMKTMVNGMKAINTASMVYGVGSKMESENRTMGYLRRQEAEAEVAHPVVRTHPETRRKSLYLDRSFTSRFQDMTREESLPLIDFLCRHATRLEFTFRLNWEKNTVAFFDNRCTQHLAINDYNGFRRVVDRVTMAGDRPA
ncbi:MAG: taurine dioxygenase [Rhodospirillales bacterium]|nr:taurine dioxygenase [Rhodospirillales bacterium]